MIGPTIYVKGDLTGQEDLLIEGRVEGKIELRQHNVTVGKNGHVKADIYGKTITIEGEVQGNLYGEEQLVLKQTSTVRGNITAPRVSLEDGSNFKGSIDMSPKDSRSPEGEQRRPVEAIKSSVETPVASNRPGQPRA
jgi:cytoskeletal protein CcmA (bactofilin family)